MYNHDLTCKFVSFATRDCHCRNDDGFTGCRY